MKIQKEDYGRTTVRGGTVLISGVGSSMLITGMDCPVGSILVSLLTASISTDMFTSTRMVTSVPGGHFMRISASSSFVIVDLFVHLLANRSLLYMD